jgi:hypothetical protein
MHTSLFRANTRMLLGNAKQESARQFVLKVRLVHGGWAGLRQINLDLKDCRRPLPSVRCC